MFCRVIRSSPTHRAGRLLLLCALSFLTLAGCTVLGPEYQAPELSEADVPTQWTSPAETRTDAELPRRPDPYAALVDRVLRPGAQSAGYGGF